MEFPLASAHSIISPSLDVWLAFSETFPMVPFKVFHNAYSNRGYKPTQRGMYRKRQIAVYLSPANPLPVKVDVDPNDVDWIESVHKAVANMIGKDVEAAAFDLIAYRTHADRRLRDMDVEQVLGEYYFMLQWKKQQEQVPGPVVPIIVNKEQPWMTEVIIDQFHRAAIKHAVDKTFGQLIGMPKHQVKEEFSTQKRIRENVSAALSDWALLASVTGRKEMSPESVRVAYAEYLASQNVVFDENLYVDRVAAVLQVLMKEIALNGDGRQFYKTAKSQPQMTPEQEQQRVAMTKSATDGVLMKVNSRAFHRQAQSATNMFEYVRSRVRKRRQQTGVGLPPATVGMPLSAKTLPLPETQSRFFVSSLPTVNSALPPSQPTDKSMSVGCSWMFGRGPAPESMAADPCKKEVAHHAEKAEVHHAEKDDDETIEIGEPVVDVKPHDDEVRVVAKTTSKEHAKMPPLEPITDSDVHTARKHIAEPHSDEGEETDESTDASTDTGGDTSGDDSTDKSADEVDDEEEELNVLAKAKAMRREKEREKEKGKLRPMPALIPIKQGSAAMNVNSGAGISQMPPLAPLAFAVASSSSSQPRPITIPAADMTVNAQMTVDPNVVANDSSQMQVKEAASSSSSASTIGSYSGMPVASAYSVDRRYTHEGKAHGSARLKTAHHARIRNLTNPDVEQNLHPRTPFSTQFSVNAQPVVNSTPAVAYVPTRADFLGVMAERIAGDPMVLMQKDSPNSKVVPVVYVPTLNKSYPTDIDFKIETMAGYREHVGLPKFNAGLSPVMMLDGSTRQTDMAAAVMASQLGYYVIN